jgi:hypothetical protein
MQALLKGRPDTGREDPAYVAGMVEILAWLTDQERAWLTHPREGLHTVCKFLPTAADVHEFLRNKRAKAEEFKPPHTAYRRLAEESGPWDLETDAERKARVVRELLGYNPGPAFQKTEQKRALVPPTAEELANLKLKTPPAPPSPYLIAQLAAEGWPFLPPQEQAA